jgi:hypothetical protein
MQQRIVQVYRDFTKTEHLQNVPIGDLEINTGAEFRPTGVERMARYAKMLLVGQGKATKEECDSFHYEVVDAKPPS